MVEVVLMTIETSGDKQQIWREVSQLGGKMDGMLDEFESWAKGLGEIRSKSGGKLDGAFQMN